MATASWNTGLLHVTNADFSAWVNELIAMMLSCGMVQTADTGQLAPGALTKPAASTSAGYRIYSMFGGMLAMKLEFGTAANTSQPAIWMTVGTGSNGSGNITGQSSTRSLVGLASAVGVAATQQSYMCYNATYGVFWIANKRTTSSYFYQMFGVVTSVDSLGAPTSKGFMTYYRSGTSSSNAFCQSVYVLGSATYAGSNNASMIYHDRTTSADGANFHPYKHYAALPAGEPISQMVSVLAVDIGSDVTFTTTPVGTTPLTYITLGDYGWSAAANRNTNALCGLYM